METPSSARTDTARRAWSILDHPGSPHVRPLFTPAATPDAVREVFACRSPSPGLTVQRQLHPHGLALVRQPVADLDTPGIGERVDQHHPPPVRPRRGPAPEARAPATRRSCTSRRTRPSRSRSRICDGAAACRTAFVTSSLRSRTRMSRRSGSAGTPASVSCTKRRAAAPLAGSAASVTRRRRPRRAGSPGAGALTASRRTTSRQTSSGRVPSCAPSPSRASAKSSTSRPSSARRRPAAVSAGRPTSRPVRRSSTSPSVKKTSRLPASTHRGACSRRTPGTPSGGEPGDVQHTRLGRWPARAAAEGARGGRWTPARRGVQQQVDEGDDLVLGELRGEQVQAGGDHGGLGVDRGQHPHGIADLRHPGGGVHALAHDVADDEGEPVPRDGDGVVPVATDPQAGSAGRVPGGHGDAGDGGEALRQQATLQHLRRAQLPLVQQRAAAAPGRPARPTRRAPRVRSRPGRAAGHPREPGRRRSRRPRAAEGRRACPSEACTGSRARSG